MAKEVTPNFRVKASDLPDAGTVGLLALGFLAADEDRLERFLALSGLDLETLRSRAQDPALHGGLLDYLLADEPLLLAFAAEQDLKPEWILALRQTLPGALPEP
jgi:hypothetical protein